MMCQSPSTLDKAQVVSSLERCDIQVLELDQSRLIELGGETPPSTRENLVCMSSMLGRPSLILSTATLQGSFICRDANRKISRLLKMLIFVTNTSQGKLAEQRLLITLFSFGRS